MKVVLYTIDCPNCVAIERILDKNNIEYERFDDKIKMSEMGFERFPVLKVGDEILQYKEAIKWIKEGIKK